jgi:hypothetical protein
MKYLGITFDQKLLESTYNTANKTLARTSELYSLLVYDGNLSPVFNLRL